MIAHELRNLNESLQAIAYAALGTQGPQVRRRRTIKPALAREAEEVAGVDRHQVQLAGRVLAERRQARRP